MLGLPDLLVEAGIVLQLANERPKPCCCSYTGSDNIMPVTSRCHSDIEVKMVYPRIFSLKYQSITLKLLAWWHHFLCDAGNMDWAFLLISPHPPRLSGGIWQLCEVLWSQSKPEIPLEMLLPLWKNMINANKFLWHIWFASHITF